MCLIVKNSKYQIADKDIVCYKVLNYSHNIWKTPFNMTIFPNDVINGKYIITDYKEFDTEFITDNKIVNEGGYHCYADKNDAVKDANTCFCSFAFECMIPKGTAYYEGDFYGMKSYAAKQLKIILKIEKI